MNHNETMAILTFSFFFLKSQIKTTKKFSATVCSLVSYAYAYHSYVFASSVTQIHIQTVLASPPPTELPCNVHKSSEKRVPNSARRHRPQSSHAIPCQKPVATQLQRWSDRLCRKWTSQRDYPWSERKNPQTNRFSQFQSAAMASVRLQNDLANVESVDCPVCNTSSTVCDVSESTRNSNVIRLLFLFDNYALQIHYRLAQLHLDNIGVERHRWRRHIVASTSNNCTCRPVDRTCFRPQKCCQSVRNQGNANGSAAKLEHNVSGSRLVFAIQLIDGVACLPIFHRSTVLYDRPPPQFQPISLAKKHALYMRLSQKYPVFLAQNETSAQPLVIESTAFTHKFADGTVEYAANRPAILVSSTSWTVDEDFGVLLQALECMRMCAVWWKVWTNSLQQISLSLSGPGYEETASASSNYPKLVCIITGKGPEKEKYLQLIGGKCWQKVRILTPWLETDDYPLVLAAADLGVCLHWSSSGLDLPMKVVDMFGSGLPVCAINYNWWVWNWSPR